MYPSEYLLFKGIMNDESPPELSPSKSFTSASRLFLTSSSEPRSSMRRNRKPNDRLCLLLWHSLFFIVLYLYFYFYLVISYSPVQSAIFPSNTAAAPVPPAEAFPSPAAPQSSGVFRCNLLRNGLGGRFLPRWSRFPVPSAAPARGCSGRDWRLGRRGLHTLRGRG